ncbi:MAG: serine/threonine protein kinase [Deltaproteobacteria bacterium]|nr:serine/threonine protein kinase [Deltaproteobacteria bacterium]
MNLTFCATCRRYFTALERCPVDDAPLSPLPRTWPGADARFEGYVLHAPIAAGGMSRIYRGTCLRDSRPVAIKVLTPALARHAHTVERFFREARLSRVLDHPNVVHVEAFGVSEDGHPMMVMELLGGESLESARRRGPMPWERAVHIAIEICHALGHAHGRRIVHRDVKPANIQLTGTPGPDERALLIDFGIAYVAADASFSAPAPGSQRVIGTPAYMSPEQIRGLPLDGRSDLYALGVVLFELLAGRRPFESDDPAELCRMHLQERPPHLEEALPDGAGVPPALCGIVDQLLCRAPSSRQPGVGALLAMLQGIAPPSRRRLPTRPRAGDGPPPTLHGVPARDGGTCERGAGVALLHVRLEWDGEGEAAGSAEAPSASDRLISAWRDRVERAGGLVQEPELGSARAWLGMLSPGEPPRRVLLRAIRLFETLVEAAPRWHDAGAPPPRVHGGIVVRADADAADPERGMVFCDADAEAAWYLAGASEPGQVLLDARAAFALGDARPICPAAAVPRTADQSAIPAWSLLPEP